MIDPEKLRDDEMYSQYIYDSVNNLFNADISMIDVLADAWKKSGSEMRFFEYVRDCCSDITGLPDYEHFLESEIRNPRIIHAQVQVIPKRWLDKYGATDQEMYNIHYEHSHAEYGGPECNYKPGYFD